MSEYIVCESCGRERPCKHERAENFGGDWHLPGCAGPHEVGSPCLSEPRTEFHTGWLGVHAEDHDDGTCRCPCFRFVRSLSPDAYEAAHADVVGEAATPPLDVERLTDALSFLGDTDVLADGSVWTVDEIAAKAAAEYARLAQQDGTEE